MTKILLADDHQLLRQGLRGLLEAVEGFSVVGEADDGLAAVEMARELTPDLIIIDVSMPRLTGIEATRQLKQECPTRLILALSMHTRRETVVEVLRAGASGYVVKTSSFDEVLRAIRSVLAGQRYLSPSIAGAVVDELMTPGTQSGLALLTSRERDVLVLIAQGKNTKEMGVELAISPRTVDVHRKNLMDKLQLHSVAELTVYAIRQGLLSVEE